MASGSRYILLFDCCCCSWLELLLGCVVSSGVGAVVAEETVSGATTAVASTVDELATVAFTAITLLLLGDPVGTVGGDGGADSLTGSTTTARAGGPTGDTDERGFESAIA